MHGSRRPWLALFVVIPLWGCNGIIADPAGDDGPDEDIRPGGRTEAGLCADVGRPELQRLSDIQYRNTIRDLFGGALGEELAGMAIYPETTIDSGFSSDAVANTVNTVESQTIEDNAELLASHLLSRAGAVIPQVMPCVASGYTEADIDGCIEGFITDFGLRAYRRPLTDGERDVARALYDAVRAEQGAVEAWSAVLQLFLQAPALIYRTERGEGAVEGAPGLIALTDWEVATRLSYLFLDSMPDDELLSAAGAGELSTAAEVEAQARRLADDPRALDTIARFHREWLRLYELEHASKEGLEEPARAALLAEGDAIVRWAMESGDYATLMTSDAFPVDPALEAIYGGSAGSLPHRRGILTSAGFTAAHAREATTHPIERGAFVRREVLCADIPPFPAGIDTAGPLESTAHLPTARERLAPLLERPDCSGCHTLFNPIGLAFENYDALGRWRDTEGGATIDASGAIAVGDAQGEFTSPEELVELIAASEQAQGCYAQQWMRFALGRAETPADRCSLEWLEERFVASGGDIRELMVAVTQTESFLYRPESEEGTSP